MPLTKWPLQKLRAERDALRKEVGVDSDRKKKYDELGRTIRDQGAKLRKLDEEIVKVEGVDERRQTAINSRRQAYVDVFKTFSDEEATLSRLYGPLRIELGNATGTLSKLEFIVRRDVDVAAWVECGEQLLDLRSGRFRGHGALLTDVESDNGLAHAWKTGTPSEIAEAMERFRIDVHKDLRQAMPASIASIKRAEWLQSIASWLYSTDHIKIEYGIQYEGVAIEQLSPGTRGIVLLLVYLALDLQDHRPLLIDQPEENLDPKSIFEELVPHFRAARRRRQVIIVTHNANLVVNTDADQVIVASAVGAVDGGLPTMSYRCGSLEHTEIRTAVCSILEGGKRAFLERERRYRLKRNESAQPSGHDHA